MSMIIKCSLSLSIKVPEFLSPYPWNVSPEADLLTIDNARRCEALKVLGNNNLGSVEL